MSKLRLMCSYGGQIVPRANGKSLFYAGGETRIVAVDRRTTASSLSSFTSHLSTTLFNKRPLCLKYQLPNEDLDSLISITNDEDLLIMLEEHARVSTTPFRIRLFLFPTKPESLGSGLLDPKASESWFSDALKSSGIVQRGQSADSVLVHGLTGLDIVGEPESVVFETSSSFGSTSSSVSMSNSSPIGVQFEEPENNKVRVPSSGSLESDKIVGSAGILPKYAVVQESHSQVASGASSFTIECESTVPDRSSIIQMQKNVQVFGYQLPQQSDAKQQQPEVQYIHGSACYLPQYSTGPLPHASYYPMYQIPMHQQQHGPFSANQPYAVYLVPVGPVQSHNTSVNSNANNNSSMALSRPPLHPQTAMIVPQMVYKETQRLIAQPTVECAAKVHGAAQAPKPWVNLPSSQGQEQFISPPEPTPSSEPVPDASMDTTDYAGELDDNLAYTQIYKTQPSAPVFSSHYQISTKGAGVLLSDSSMPQLTNVKHQAS